MFFLCLVRFVPFLIISSVYLHLRVCIHSETYIFIIIIILIKPKSWSYIYRQNAHDDVKRDRHRRYKSKVVVVVVIQVFKKRDINEINFVCNDSVLSWLLLVKHHILHIYVSHVILTYIYRCMFLFRVCCKYLKTFYVHTKLNGIIPAKYYMNRK